MNSKAVLADADRFADTVGCMGDDLHTVSRLIHRLVVKAVHEYVGRKHRGEQIIVVRKRQPMDARVHRVIKLSVRLPLAEREMLDEGAAAGDIEHLTAAADPKHG